MTKGIENNAFTRIIADKELSREEKVATLAEALKSPQGLKDLEAFKDHLYTRRIQAAKNVIASLSTPTFSLTRDFMMAVQAVREAPQQDYTNVLMTSGKALVALAERADFLDKMHSANNDVLNSCRILESALRRAGHLDAGREMREVKNQLEQHADVLELVKTTNKTQAKDIYRIAEETTVQSIRARAPRTRP